MIERFEKFHQNIALAHKFITKIKTVEMDKYGLKAANVMCLYFLGKNPDGLTPMQLCQLCGEDKAGISKSLTALREKNYISADDKGDKKYRIIYRITKDGNSVYEKINSTIVDVVNVVGTGLSDEERCIFYKSLDIIVSNLQSFYKTIE